MSAGGSLFSGFTNWIGDQLGISDLARTKKANKELSKYNNDLNFETWQNQFEAQNTRQDYLLQNQASIQKQSYMDAGLNPALMNQGVTSLGAVSSPSGGNSSGSTVSSGQNSILPFMDFLLSKKKNDAEVGLLNEEQRSKQIENNHKEDYWNLTIQQMQTQLKEAQATLDDKIDQVNVNLEIAYKESELKDWQILEAQKSLDKLIDETKSIQIDNKYKDAVNANSLKKICAETRKLVAECSFEETKSYLASKGILIGSNWLTQLLSVSAIGAGTDFANDWMQLMKDMSGALGEGIGDVMQAVAGGMVDIISNGAKGTVKGLIPDWILNLIKTELAK